MHIAQLILHVEIFANIYAHSHMDNNGDEPQQEMTVHIDKKDSRPLALPFPR